jgi:hypothetical protein
MIRFGSRVTVWFLAVFFVFSGSVFALDSAQITQLASKVHGDFRTERSRGIAAPQALQTQREFLSKQSGIREVRQLKGGNLLVKFQDNQELLMLLGENRLGAESLSMVPSMGASGGTTGQMLAANQVLQPASTAVKPVTQINPAVFYIPPCAPASNRALIFDCLEDDANVVSPKAWQQVKADLEALGYFVTVAANNNANLANAALFDNGEYGVIFMRGHGGDLGGDFGFLVRPWYASYPPANSGYTGTLRASAYNNATHSTQFGYIITGQFSQTYWANKAFPGTIFFLESCHGADPGALPGMPTWTINHGASAWLGWNESVSFNCGDNGTALFFQKMALGNTIGQGVSAVYATGCRPPELVSFPAGREACKPGVWRLDNNESAVPDGRDFRLLKLVSDGAKLHATITFYAAPAFDEFFFYASNATTGGATVLIRVHPTNFEIYKPTSPGLYNNKVYTGGPIKSGNNYTMVIPWDVAFGTANPIYVWLYDMAGKDLLPDAGRVLVRR